MNGGFVSARKLYVSGTLAATLVAGITGCGTSGSSNSTNHASNGNATTTSASANSAKTLFPNGITLLVGFAPGGANDVAARVMQPYLQKQLGVPVVVQNLPGAGGAVAAAKFYKESPSTPTFLVSYLQTLDLEQHLKHGQFNTSKMTEVYGVYGNSDNVLITAENSKYKTFKDLQNAKSTITVGISGVGNAAWLGAAYLANINHLKVKVVPFQSGSQSTAAAIGGSVDVSMTSLPAAAKLIGEGKAVGLVQMGTTRNSLISNVPTITDVGGTSTEAYEDNIGLFGPPNMPQKEVQVLNQALAKVSQNSAFIKKADASGLYPAKEDSAQFTQLTKQFDSTVVSQQSMLMNFMNSAG